ncbi:hypothetical protein SAMN04490208_4104 [Pseudomonas poae]|uniref:Uncharacterized protein n=1 Tax=Pseudomonas poae TaxID=200451 RepID=A0ABY0RVY6_9PSED|nr:hypothetical protein [Pseudomonas sp. 25 E 4]SDO53811.1 hypothetical protein SAMN04490208_4104 [Pseudomonas poae]
MWEPGLPAMQAPRCISYTAVLLSQASQLPHKPAPTRDHCKPNLPGQQHLGPPLPP